VMVVAKLTLDVQGVAVSEGNEKSDVSPPRIVSGPDERKEHASLEYYPLRHK
jgi:hypothetical protein